jgi:hypothetical protein
MMTDAGPARAASDPDDAQAACAGGYPISVLAGCAECDLCERGRGEERSAASGGSTFGADEGREAGAEVLPEPDDRCQGE